MNQRDIRRIVAAYDAIVWRNTAHGYDAVKVVSEDTSGEIGWEMVQTAGELGYVLTDSDVDDILAAAEAYRAHLAADVASPE